MEKNVVILLAEDDEGHAGLIKKNLSRAGIVNEIFHFKDGQKVLNFLFCQGKEPHRKPNTPYVLLLDIRMPRVDGLEVLARVKQDPELRKMPIIMVTTTDDPREVALCHELGCSNYVTKPIDYDKFVNAVRSLGLFLAVVKVPEINGVMEK
ncbi:response regulator [Desulfocicer niacini]